MLSRAMLCYLGPVFEAKALVVAGVGWDSSVEQCCSCCVRSDLFCVPQMVELAGKLCVEAAANCFNCLSFHYLVRGGIVNLTNSNSKLNLHLVVKTGEFWEIEFSSEYILKSPMKDFICGSQHLQTGLRLESSFYPYCTLCTPSLLRLGVFSSVKACLSSHLAVGIPVRHLLVSC